MVLAGWKMSVFFYTIQRDLENFLRQFPAHASNALPVVDVYQPCGGHASTLMVRAHIFSSRATSCSRAYAQKTLHGVRKQVKQKCLLNSGFRRR